MARTGDGERRSNSRRLTATLCLRLSSDEKQHLEQRASDGGYPSLSAWALDRLRQDGMGMRERRVAAGRLGQHAAQLASLVRTGKGREGRDVRGELQKLQADVLEMQRHILRGNADAGEETP